MIPPKKEHPKIKAGLHPRNRHSERYDLKKLMAACPLLVRFVRPNAFGDMSIDFFDPEAVKMLNKALLKEYYDINEWDIPKHYLCPPVPGRADYIHSVADLLGDCTKGKIPFGNTVKVLDIGTGANFIYPVIGIKEYGWYFVGSDIDPVAIESAEKIIKKNPALKQNAELRIQKNPSTIFQGIIREKEWFNLSICNPPFHSSIAEARSGSLRKLNNLNHTKTNRLQLNFGGQPNELWCEGGEKKFAERMIVESKQFAFSCFWFSILISKQSHLDGIYRLLDKASVAEVKTIYMQQGNKRSRIIAWTFLDKVQQDKKTALWNK
jgi:23S rRNA (adenine1618-N6)-methyltransferase